MYKDYPHYLTSLQNSIRNYWDKKALNDVGGESYTFGQMAVRVEKLHCFFEGVGIKQTQKIAICAHNCARWGTAFLGINTYGAVAVPILFDFLPEAVNNLVDHSEAVGLFTTKEKWSKLDATKMPELLFAIDIEGWHLLYSANEKVAEAHENMDAEFESKYPDGFKSEMVNYPIDNMDDLAVINYTSGSTGNPKGVMLTQRNFSAMVDYCNRHMPISPEYNMVSMLPMAHMYGLMIEFVYQVCNGCAIYWLGKAPTPTTLLKAFSDYKPHLLVTVPLVMEKIFKSKIKPKVEKPSVKILCKIPGLNQIVYKKIRNGLCDAFGGNVREFIMGGAALNPEVEKWFRAIKLHYTVGYGMTEACPLLAYSPWSSFAPGSCGREIDIDEIRIDSPDPQHKVGEIQAIGESVCIGYYKNEDESKHLFTEDGWLRTGDLGVMDAKGNIYIRGRSKAMILGPSGQNIYPEEVEAVVNNQNYVAECVVVDRDKKLVALVYLNETETRRLDEASKAAIPANIVAGANKALPAYSQLSNVELVDKPFEKTPKMSIKRFLYK